jgi:hypothetical protein
MAFYNRLMAQPVQKFIDLLGKVEPLDVVNYGGASAVTATVPANSGSVVLLGATSAGFAYRMHMFTAIAPAGAILLYNAAGPTYYAALSAQVPSLYLGGQLTALAVSAFNSTAAALQVTLTYDLIITPSIQ